MGQFLHIFTIVSTIISAVQTVEKHLGPGNGVVKKAAVVNQVLSVIQSTSGVLGVAPDTDAVGSAVGGITDGIVSLFNLLGIFKPKA